jgi:hypothetical protein
VREVLTDDSRASLRGVGGLVLATGVIVLVFRRTSFADPWRPGAIFLLLLVTTAFLYATGFLAARWSGRPVGWRSAFVVYAIVLVPFTLFEFLLWIKGDTTSSWNAVWIFVVTAGFAFPAARVAGVRYATLLGAVALAVAWLALWNEILNAGLADFDALRWVLLGIAAILVALAGFASLGGWPEGTSADLVTVAGLAALLAGGAVFLIGLFVPVEAVLPGESTGSPLQQGLFWDIETLVVALALIGYAGVAPTRGPGYVGAFGLIAFIYSVGLDLDDSSPAGKVLGWPLILIVVGALVFAAGVVPALRRGDP